MELNNKQKKYLKGLAHNLNPVVMVGNNGINDGVLKEIETTLEAHELIKIRIRCEGQEELKPLVDDIAQKVNATLVQVLGHSVTLYRQGKEPKINLP
ncbi:ribosome assembly RNA-binding protein YhbY [Pseudobacteriovorax antillogorgiicola]|uniref:RNA-binding protein n=1 Tax=Pseudobacteriovorax antillogorgiicola TaxID=1513793 RepID=A0A1Y6BQF7_9BACT|nr:ribosome assembly RNA-binding protein YhbY [Pseudobacteriovorax antillogorgiicola]TCS53929.1 RNA-binding protein [Pseudobacteriovorax antillogorgiicola]SMF20461.1 RNA-binding protein [Pseudobacteriovorax antillogorgiicola]